MEKNTLDRAEAAFAEKSLPYLVKHLTAEELKIYKEAFIEGFDLGEDSGWEMAKLPVGLD